jgi:hypothetical protein
LFLFFRSTMVLVCFSLLMVFSPSTPVLAAGPTTVTVSGPVKVNPGDVFSVAIAVSPGTGASIAGIQFDLTYTASVASPTNTSAPATEGTWLSQSGTNSTYFLAGTVGSGVITSVTGVITTPGRSVSVNGTFATINFTATSTGGACSFTLSNVIAGDINGVSLPVTLVNGQTTVNRAPVLTAIGSKSVNEGSLLQFTISGSDADGDTLTYSAVNLPAGATFNASTRTFSWTPTYIQAGVYNTVTFRVTDGMVTTQEIITITVVQPYPDWDINGDAHTNVLDMIVIGQAMGSTGTVGWSKVDVNTDGTINVLDMIIVGQHWTG